MPCVRRSCEASAGPPNRARRPCHAETEKRDCENSFLTPFSVRPGFGCAIELGPDELGRAGLPNRAE